MADITELSYNLRHYELHGRDLKDPWSCRHTAIHHRYSLENGQSTWIMIQSPKVFRQNLGSLLAELSARASYRDEHPLTLHIRYLMSSGVNLRKYLNYINDNLTILACFPPYSPFCPTGRLTFYRTGKCLSFGRNTTLISTFQSVKTYNLSDENWLSLYPSLKEQTTS